MVGVTSVNLGGIEVDVEDVADRLRRLKVPLPSNLRLLLFQDVDLRSENQHL